MVQSHLNDPQSLVQVPYLKQHHTRPQSRGDIEQPRVKHIFWPVGARIRDHGHLCDLGLIVPHAPRRLVVEAPVGNVGRVADEDVQRALSREELEQGVREDVAAAEGNGLRWWPGTREEEEEALADVVAEVFPREGDGVWGDVDAADAEVWHGLGEETAQQEGYAACSCAEVQDPQGCG